MLCQLCDIQTVHTDIKKAEFHYVEIKFDGERFQLHYQNGEFMYFSRLPIPIPKVVITGLLLTVVLIVTYVLLRTKEMVTITPIRTDVIRQMEF